MLVIRASLVLGPDPSAAEKGSSWSRGIESGSATPVFPGSVRQQVFCVCVGLEHHGQIWTPAG